VGKNYSFRHTIAAALGMVQAQCSGLSAQAGDQDCLIGGRPGHWSSGNPSFLLIFLTVKDDLLAVAG